MSIIPHHHIKIVPYSNALRMQLLDVWERSVLATHHFLKPADFESIKALVHSIDFNQFEVYCLMHQNEVAGFMGIAEQKIEMLFLSPAYVGKGLGKKLMEFALTEVKANKVDVNEQNIHAVAFYKKFGFQTYERSEKDDQGNDYPLLRMQLAL